MVREDWVSVGIPRGVIDELDSFLRTEDAKKIGVMNRQQIITLLLRKFIDDGIELLSKSNNLSSIQSQLENKIDKKIDGLVEIMSSVMAKHGVLYTDDKNLLKIRKKNIRKKLPSSEISKEIKKKLSGIEKE